MIKKESLSLDFTSLEIPRDYIGVRRMKFKLRTMWDYYQMCYRARQVTTLQNLYEIIRMIPKHNSFWYINRKRLGGQYCKNAYESLLDNKVYIVLSDTKSAASELISVFTSDPYNHVSLAFDSNLSTLVSFNGGMNQSYPGLNTETKNQLLQKGDSNYRVYHLELTQEQKKRVIDYVMKVDEEGNSYNLLGLLIKHSIKPNIMFCSQFVYTALKQSGMNCFEKCPLDIKPMDFIKGALGQKLKFLYQVQQTVEESKLPIAL